MLYIRAIIFRGRNDIALSKEYVRHLLEKRNGAWSEIYNVG
jgi:hypothetical protein